MNTRMINNGGGLLQPLRSPSEANWSLVMTRLTVLEEGEFSLTLGDNALMWILHSEFLQSGKVGQWRRQLILNYLAQTPWHMIKTQTSRQVETRLKWCWQSYLQPFKICQNAHNLLSLSFHENELKWKKKKNKSQSQMEFTHSCW